MYQTPAVMCIHMTSEHSIGRGIFWSNSIHSTNEEVQMSLFNKLPRWAAYTNLYCSPKAVICFGLQHCICSLPTYQLSKYLSQILFPLVSISESHVVNSEEFASFIQTQKLTGREILASFDVVSLFTCVPVGPGSEGSTAKAVWRWSHVFLYFT